ncbi:reverse transcriptase [Corchorus capsularis]|uniref:Reverse transcriptase n=1 Tax=Corchorus capsularis TaxID=210143 RepID=A0A1R3G182_COCAP|nr:reverse transcriptase [Corchorus capsularis]
MEFRGRSGEEDDQLELSTKKVKAAAGPADGQAQPMLSFKDAMMGGRGIPSPGAGYDEFGSLESDEGLIHIAERDGWPLISLSENFKAQIRRQWEDCLIVKPLGRNISYNVLCDRLHKLWCPKGDWDLIDVGHGFCIAKFSSLEDLRYVMDEGPWTVFGHYLTMRRWQPDFTRFLQLSSPLQFGFDFRVCLLNILNQDSLWQWVILLARLSKWIQLQSMPPEGGLLGFASKWSSVSLWCRRVGLRGPCAFCPQVDESNVNPVENGVKQQGVTNDGSLQQGNIVGGGAQREPTVNPPTGDFGPWMIAQSRKPRRNVNHIPKSRVPLNSGKDDREVEAWAQGVYKASGTSAGPKAGVNKAQKLPRKTINVGPSNVNKKAVDSNKAVGFKEVEAIRSSVHQSSLRVNAVIEKVVRTSPARVGENSDFAELTHDDAMEDTFHSPELDVGRGAGNKKFRRHVIDMINIYKSSIMAVVEPRVSGATARRVLRELRMPKFHIADPEGFAGGIWLCWEESILSLEVVFSSSQMVHAFVQKPGMSKFLLTIVYASPILEIRRRLWSSMVDFSESVDVPWVVMGDFNDVANSSEKLCGQAPSIGRCLSFNGMILSCGLIDLGFNGPSFTWYNKRKGLARVQERLDRVLANANWRLLFPDAMVQHLPRLHSDHCPILLYSWANFDGDICGKGEKLAELLQAWNKDEFGNIFERKKQLRARIAGLQCSLSLHYSHQLQMLETDLLREYNQILQQEETFWAQNSRVQWLQQGEKNTRFFHLSTICRRRRKRISMLRNNDGKWVTENAPLQTLVLNFYRGLYANEEGERVALESLLQPTISPIDVGKLTHDIAPSEVRAALFQMKPWKAPGVDGFQAGFFQNCWESVGQDLLDLVQDAFRTGSFNVNLNQTLIVLIPNVGNPEYVKQFRPISLCTVAYKLIIKVLVNRLRPLLGDLIGPLQSSFIHGRQAANNIFIAQEMIHTIKKSKSKNGLMAIKIDLENAYDRLIMFCVENASMSVLWNGEKTEFFQPGRGLRQGDPISPYLFVLCMERLGHLILHEVQNGSWKPIVMGRGGPSISHLFFADDLFLFGRATEQQANVIRQVLDAFCDASGAKVSLDKFKLYIPPQGLGGMLKKVVKGTFRELVDKVSNRLNGWKCKFLSLAGRATLVSSVTSSIPTYSMLTTKIPQGVIAKLDCLNRRFLWGGSEDRRTINLVRWEEVCKPKIFGGLGLRSMEFHNRVLLQKTAWRFLMEPDSLWVRLLKSKYAIPDDVVSFVKTNVSKPLWSYSWRGLFGALSELIRGLKWRIDSGSNVCFWTDVWLEKPIVTSFAVVPPYVNNEARVSDFIDGDGQWNSDLIFAQLPLDTAMQVIGYPLPRVMALEDSHVWASTANGKFTTPSAYMNLLQEVGINLSGYLTWLWKLNIPSRWIFFLWLAWRGRLVTNGLRFNWGMAASASCVLCGAPVEGEGSSTGG